MHINKKRAGAIVGATVVGLAGAGVAFAYWTSTGGGTGTATTSSGVSTIAVTGDDTVNNLAPGHAPESITATITNPTNQNAFVTNLHVAIDSIDSGSLTCDAGSYSLSTTDPGAALYGGYQSGTSNINIPVALDLAPNGSAGDSTTKTFYIGFVDDSATNQDGCQNAVVHLAYTTS